MHVLAFGTDSVNDSSVLQGRIVIQNINPVKQGVQSSSGLPVWPGDANLARWDTFTALHETHMESMTSRCTRQNQESSSSRVRFTMQT